MKRKVAVGLLVALVLVLGIAATAMAAGPGPNGGNRAAMAFAGQGAALHGTFVDADGDGVCDSYEAREPAQDGTGNRWGANAESGVGRHFLHSRFQHNRFMRGRS